MKKKITNKGAVDKCYMLHATGKSRFATISSNGGIATLELLIALALAVVLLTGATMVSFGGQTAALDTQLTGQGMPRASVHLASTTAGLASSVTVWNSLSSGQEDESSDPEDNFYDRFRTITDISPCVKFVGSDTTWTSEKNRGQYLGLQTLVGSIAEAKKLGGGCDPFPLTSNWEKPQAYDFPSGVLHSGSKGTDVTVVRQSGRRLALLSTEFNPGGGYNLWVVDVTDPANPGPTAGKFSEDDQDVNAVAAIPGYAFLASASTTAQFQIVDISDPTNPILVAKERLKRLDGTPLTNAEALSIFYYDKKIYIGTQYFVCSGCHEFHIYDVSVPLNPVRELSADVNRDINAIAVRDGVAYLATGPGDSEPYTPLKAYDVSPLLSDGTTNPQYLQKINEFIISHKRQGTSVYVLGNTIYFGTVRATSGSNFYIVRASDMQSLVSPSLVLDLGGTNNKARVSAIVVQGSLAFIGVEGEGVNPQNTFQVWNVSNPTAPFRVNTCTAGSPYPQNVTGLMYMDGLIFTSFRDNDALRVIYDSLLSC